jgi:CheY-like chemotaxis protein
LLTPLGFTISEANSGAACLTAIEKEMPDILLMDIAMPGMDGWEVCRHLREQGLVDLPIIIISANVFDPTARQSDSLFCNDFIAKPLVLEDLLSKLKLHLGIEWIATAKAAPQAGLGMRLIPPQATLAHLLELGAIGYVKGILAALEEIEGRNALYAPFCAELRALVERFRLPEYTNRLKEWNHENVDHV